MRTYVSRLHLASVVALVVLTLGFGLVGWLVRPPSNGFPTVPGNVALLVGTPGWRSFSETLNSTAHHGVVLTLEGSPTATTNRSWTLWVNEAGAARLCTPRYVPVENGAASVLIPGPQHVNPHQPFATDTPGIGVDLLAIDGRGEMYVRLCWSSDAPMAFNGAYLSAVFPPVQPYAIGRTSDYVISRTLNLGSVDAADYAVQSLAQPTDVIPGGWQWSGKPPASEPLQFSAVNSTETQHDTYLGFLSGIAFGVAGGAFVSLVLELLDPLRTRRQRREPAPSD
jgi:hypothetical protein